MIEKTNTSQDGQQPHISQSSIEYSQLPPMDEFGNIVAPTTLPLVSTQQALRDQIFGKISSVVMPAQVDALSTEHAAASELTASKQSSMKDNLSSQGDSDTEEVLIASATTKAPAVNSESLAGTADFASSLSSNTFDSSDLPVDDFITACEQGNLADLERLFVLPGETNADYLITYQGKLLFAKNGQAFVAASSNNHPKVMEILLDKCTSTATLIQVIRAQKDAAFKNAFDKGHAEALRIILHEIFKLHPRDKSVYVELTQPAFKEAVSKNDTTKLKTLIDSAPTLEAATLMIEHAFLPMFQEGHLKELNTLLNILPDYLTDARVRLQLINSCITKCAKQFPKQRYELAKLLFNEAVTSKIFPNISDAFIAASGQRQEFVMEVLLDMSSGQSFRQSMLQTAFNNACLDNNNQELQTLLTCIPKDEREQLIHANNDQAFVEAARDGWVNTMRVLRDFTLEQHAQQAMVGALGHRPWKSAIEKEQFQVLEFYLEHYYKTSNGNTFNQMIDEGTQSAKESKKEQVLQTFSDFISTMYVPHDSGLTVDAFLINSCQHAITHDQRNVWIFYCEHGSKKDAKGYSLFSMSDFRMIRDAWPVAYDHNKTEALDVLLESFDEKEALQKFIGEKKFFEERRARHTHHTQDYLDPKLAWKTGKRLRELRAKEYNPDKMSEMLGFAGAVIARFNDASQKRPQNAAAIPYVSTILSTTDREIVFGVLTTPMPSMSQKLSQLTIRRSTDLASPQLHMTITSLEDRNKFYRAIIGRLPSVATTSSEKSTGR